MTQPEVRLLRAEDRTALDAFLAASSEATLFHRPEWHAIIEATYGHKCDFWTAWSGDRVVGIFPVVDVRFPGLGRKLVALPYQMYSGIPIGDNQATRDALLRAAIDRAQSVGGKYLEVRNHAAAPGLEEFGFMTGGSGVVTTTVQLSEGVPRIEHGHRQRLRKAEKKGLEIVDSKDLRDLADFRRLYMMEMRSMGAPQAGWTFFENLHRHARSFYQLLLARVEGRTIGGMLSVGDERMMFSRCSATASPEARAYNAGAALWWRALNSAAERGCREYNCGMSWQGDRGLLQWKEGWGGVTRPIHVYSLPLRGQAPKPGSYFEGYALAKAAWRRLPMPVADVVGQIVTRWVG